jgi:hypothetical protein
MYEREEVIINVFLVGPINFAQPQKRKPKGRKGKKKWGCYPISIWAKFLKPKKRAENLLNVHYIYIYIEQNLRLYPFK